MPELIKSQEAVSNIDKNQLGFLRGMTSPPGQAVITFEAVCALLGEKKNDWPSARALLTDVNKFVNRLINYDKDNINPDFLKKLNKVLSKPEFDLENIKKNLSYAYDIALFAKSMKVYADVNVIVKPKKEQVAKLNLELDIVEKELSEKVNSLNKVK